LSFARLMEIMFYLLLYYIKGTSGDYVGDQIGASSRYNFNSSLNFEAGWFHLFKGQFAKTAVS